MFWVYILASINRVLYVGSTDDLPRRLSEHKRGRSDAFTARYRVHRLVYFEGAPSRSEAMRRERQIKTWRRSKKIALIESVNPDWKDRVLVPPARQIPRSRSG